MMAKNQALSMLLSVSLSLSIPSVSLSLSTLSVCLSLSTPLLSLSHVSVQAVCPSGLGLLRGVGSNIVESASHVGAMTLRGGEWFILHSAHTWMEHTGSNNTGTEKGSLARYTLESEARVGTYSLWTWYLTCDEGIVVVGKS